MIQLKSDQDIETMRESCELAACCLNMIEQHIKPGVTTLELNDLCHNFIVDHGAIAAPLNYKGFPKSICSSVNNVVCHGIPNAKQRLANGDIVNIDVTTIFKDYHGDTSRTFYVGNPSQKARRLVECARESLNKAIAVLKPGVRLGDIGFAIQSYAESMGYTVVREFVGHGIGKNFHEDPQVLHYGKPGKGLRLTEGMCFTIEPMINQGDWRTKILRDKWTAVTLDGSLSAQFEHTIAIKQGFVVDVLTELKS